jgi:hypothetical protein
VRLHDVLVGALPKAAAVLRFSHLDAGREALLLHILVSVMVESVGSSWSMLQS